MDDARLNGARNLKKRRVNKTKHLISKKKGDQNEGKRFFYNERGGLNRRKRME